VERFIVETLHSVQAQTFRDWEAVVVDDGSTDRTAEIVQSFTADPRIRLIRQPNSSQAVARNTGIHHSTGEFIAFLDADDLWEPEKLTRQMTLFPNPCIGLTHTSRLCIDSTEKLLSQGRQQRVPCGDALPQLLLDNFITTSSVIVRRNLLTGTGLEFRTERQGVEDWDLLLRLARLTRFGYLDEPLLRYRIHSNNISAQTLKMLAGVERTLDDFTAQLEMDTSLTPHHRRQLLQMARKSRLRQILRAAHRQLATGDYCWANRLFRRALAMAPFSPRCHWGLLKCTCLSAGTG